MLLAFVVFTVAGGMAAALAGTTVAATAGQAAIHHGETISFSTHASKCGLCHQKQYNEWRYAAGSDLKTVGQGTYHAISSTEPMYKTMLGTVDATMQNYCRGCHESGNAWGVVDKINNIPTPRTVNVEEGINCLVCHFDGRKIVSVQDMKDPLFCATCHNENTGLVEVYAEWITDYRNDKTCQQCHMKDGSHLFLGYNSPSFVKKAVVVSEPSLPAAIYAGQPFGINFTLSNTGAGHSVPEDLFRLLRARVSIENSSSQQIYANETVFYKHNTLFGENPSDTVVIKAGEIKPIEINDVIITSPGIYTVRVELLQDSNRVNASLNTTAFMGSTYKTILVQ